MVNGGAGSGAFSVAANSSLSVGGYEFSSSSAINGAGSVTLSNSNMRGTYNVAGGTSFGGGTTVFFTSSTVQNVGSTVSMFNAKVDFLSGEAISTGDLTMTYSELRGTDTFTANGLTTANTSNSM